MTNRTRNGRRVYEREWDDLGPNGHLKQSYVHPDMANPGNVIDCTAGGNNMGSGLTHDNEAPFPESLAEFFVLTFCPPGGLCVDPFSGSGTTAAVALRHGRRALAFDIRASQIELTRRRVSGETPSLFTPSGCLSEG